jgi:hypothetical protein
MRYKIFIMVIFILCSNPVHGQEITYSTLINILSQNIIQVEKTMLNCGFKFTNISTYTDGESNYENTSLEKLSILPAQKSLKLRCNRTTYLKVHAEIIGANLKIDEYELRDNDKLHYTTPLYDIRIRYINDEKIYQFDIKKIK